MESIEEKVSKGMIGKLAIFVTGREDDLKAQVIVKLEGDRYAYESTFKVDRSLFDPDSDSIEQFFQVAKDKMRQVLDGTVELNAVV